MSEHIWNSTVCIDSPCRINTEIEENVPKISNCEKCGKSYIASMKIENEYENLCQNCEAMNKIVSRVMKQIKLPPTATGCCNQCGFETTFLIKTTKFLNNEIITKLLCGKCSEEKQTISSNEMIHIACLIEMKKEMIEELIDLLNMEHNCKYYKC